MSPPSRPLAWLLVAAAWVYVASVIVGGPGHRLRPVIVRATSVAPAPPPAPVASPQPAAPGVTVTFWNLQWFPGHKPVTGAVAKAHHLAAVVPVLEKLNPDVLGLEEVANFAAAQSVADHLKGFKVDVCSQFPLPDSPEIGRQQVVLCSRLPVLQAWAEEWRAGANGVSPRRGFVVAAYQPAAGQVLLVYGLHLKSNKVDTPGGETDNAAMREESARQLIAHVRTMTAAYSAVGAVSVLVGGDLNTSLDDPAFAKETTLRDLRAAGFQWAWQDVPLEKRYTAPGGGPYRAECFDHLFLLGAGLRFADPWMELTSKAASDHRPVTARLIPAPAP